ncbi:hypothetical protein M758_4G116500 [Ceratodon purpureus]|uniref:Secreted protein n=1 Tax=Ceratodon purpureus TaxID=3225 RepID=A0A8T0IA68_CERPU|nr:hypothetical protein KC19_4G116500 [Ceratodon purpureus]KAG0619098.1 hypothetical protein M758_4G116500 [Ceratodon purpureus]
MAHSSFCLGLLFRFCDVRVSCCCFGGGVRICISRLVVFRMCFVIMDPCLFHELRVFWKMVEDLGCSESSIQGLLLPGFMKLAG